MSEQRDEVSALEFEWHEDVLETLENDNSLAKDCHIGNIINKLVDSTPAIPSTSSYQAVTLSPQQQNNTIIVLQNVPQNADVLLDVDTRLKEYLEANSVGKEILKEYEANENTLKKTTRDKLVRLVIRREKDWQLKDISYEQHLSKFEIDTKRFIILSREICRIFQHEYAATYFSPFKKVNGTEIPTSGKLWEHFNYEKRRLREVGLVQAIKSNTVKTPVHLVTVEETEKLQWLKNHVNDWTKVEEYWKDTFKARRKQLLVDKIPVATYIGNYLCLTVTAGASLIESDFQLLHPNVEIISTDNWTILKGCIKGHLRSDKEKISALDKSLILTLLSNALSEEQEDFLTFYLLPYVITSQRPKKRKKKNSNEPADENTARPHKLSIQERRETFILHLQTASDLNSSIENLKRRLQKRGQSFQPLIIAVGELTNIQQYLVVVNEVHYEKQSCIEAITFAFKIFFAFDCQYPETSLTLWLFIQKCLFGLNLQTDINNLSLNIIIGNYLEKVKPSQ